MSICQSDGCSLDLPGVGKILWNTKSSWLKYTEVGMLQYFLCAVLHCLLQHCGSHTVPCWKAPEMSLGMLCGSLTSPSKTWSRLSCQCSWASYTQWEEMNILSPKSECEYPVLMRPPPGWGEGRMMAWWKALSHLVGSTNHQPFPFSGSNPRASGGECWSLCLKQTWGFATTGSKPPLLPSWGCKSGPSKALSTSTNG